MRTLGFIAAWTRGAIAAGSVKSAWSVLLLIALLFGPFGVAGAAEYYGVDPGGSRCAELAQINTGNVDRLVTAWNYRTGDLARRDAALLRHSKSGAGVAMGRGGGRFRSSARKLGPQVALGCAEHTKHSSKLEVNGLLPAPQP